MGITLSVAYCIIIINIFYYIVVFKACDIKMGSYAHDISRMTVRLTELKYNSTKPSTILAYVNVQVKKLARL